MLKHYNAIVFFGLSAMFLFLGISKTISHGSVWTVAMIVLGALILTLGIVFRIALKSKGRPAGIDYVKKSLPHFGGLCALCCVFLLFNAPSVVSLFFRCGLSGLAWLGADCGDVFVSAFFVFVAPLICVFIYFKRF